MRCSQLAVVGGLLAVVAAGFARRALFVVRVDGDSMTPTYRPEDAVLVVRLRQARVLRRGDVVVFDLPAEIAGPPGYLVKRVAAVAGDPMPTGRSGGLVERGQVFLQGDAPSSYDSRAFGTVAVDRVHGRVIARLNGTPPVAGGR